MHQGKAPAAKPESGKVWQQLLLHFLFLFVNLSAGSNSGKSTANASSVRGPTVLFEVEHIRKNYQHSMLGCLMSYYMKPLFCVSLEAMEAEATAAKEALVHALAIRPLLMTLLFS